MNNFFTKRTTFPLLAVLCSLFVSVYFINVPYFVNTCKYKFSSIEASKDIKVISKKHHSVENPKERRIVKNYLYARLYQLGGSPLCYDYDSIKFRFGGYYNIVNLYACFNPPTVTDSTQYILLSAHYDSRFRNFVKRDTLYSYGAADDGYGVAVILESIKNALFFRNEWKQGVKVLFTDSEENDLDGMTQAYKHNKEIFKNVNFTINIDARGVKGPALLFETSSPNDKLMSIFTKASYPCTYSLTTQVYKKLSNDTDFTIIKNSIPGLNFAVLDNLHYYHTDKDNYSNISLSSLKHYGIQIEPILHDYLTVSKYGSEDSLKGSHDCIFFTLPLFGLIKFTNCQYFIFNILTLVLFLISMVILCKELYKNNVNASKMLLKWFLITIGSLLSSLIIGEFIAWIFSLINGLKFNPISLKYVTGDKYIFIISSIVMIAVISLLFAKNVKKGVGMFYAFQVVVLTLLFIFSLVLGLLYKENFIFLLPLFCLSLSISVSRLKFCGLLWLLSLFFISLLMISILYILYIALTIGIMGVILMIGVILILAILSCFHSYIEKLV